MIRGTELAQPLVLNLDRLGTENTCAGCTLWEGKYFSGIAFEAHEATGTILAIAGFRHGMWHGAIREWDAAGRPLEEEYSEGGAPHGPSRKWYDNGQVAEFAYSERFINLHRKRWDENGRLIDEKVLLENEPRWAKLIEERQRGPRPIVDIDLATLTFFERPEGWGRNETDLPWPHEPPTWELCHELEARSLARR